MPSPPPLFQGKVEVVLMGDQLRVETNLPAFPAVSLLEAAKYRLLADSMGASVKVPATMEGGDLPVAAVSGRVMGRRVDRE